MFKMFTKLFCNKSILSYVFKLNTNKVNLLLNYNNINYCSINNRLIFTSIHVKNLSLNQSGLQSMDLNIRKSMTKYIRHCLPISSNVRMDWNQLRLNLKLNFNLNNDELNDFKRIIIPIVSHSDRSHSNVLISLDNYLRQSLSEEKDPLLLTYHFLLLTKIIEKCSHYSEKDNIKLCEKLLTQILFSSTDDLEKGVITRIVVIIRNCLLSLANSSTFNCLLAINLWTIMLNRIKEYDNNWHYFIFKPTLITSQLFEISLQKSLRSEAIELAQLSYKAIDFQFSDSNIEIWLQILLRINSNDENIKFLETLKFADSKIDIKYLCEIQLLLDRMCYDWKIEKSDNYFEIIEIWSKSGK